MKRRYYDDGSVRPLTVFIVIVCAAVIAFLGVFFYSKMLSYGINNPAKAIVNIFSKNPFGDREYVRILFLGVDNSDKKGIGLCDTMVLFTINTKTKEARALTFPRDTYIDCEYSNGHKLNSAIKNGGAENVVRTIESQFLYPITIDYYVMTTTQGLKSMVDELGGVYIKVDKNMDYDDNYGNLHIHIKAKPEKQLLDGKQAEGFVRFRKDKFGDTGYSYVDGEKVSAGRTARQQQFMMALCNRVISLSSKVERADFLKKCYDNGYIETNLELTDWDGLADFMLDMKPEEMLMEVLPGTPEMIHGGSYWVVDEEAMPETIDRAVQFKGINPNIPDKLELDSKGRPIEGTPSKPPYETKITVLNGSGVKGVASSVASVLEDEGYSVLSGNASDYNHNITEIRCSEQAIGFAVKRILGYGEVSINRKQKEDVVVVVGKDYETED
ncbi:MAG: LCP family protein [Armatimonadetes bacterium]|nr:LCP family protein [Candidatus Hippobium faecium]